jgi:hypothetical protein
MGIYVEIKDSVLLECENSVTAQMLLMLDVRNHSSSTAVSHHRRQEFSIILLGKPQTEIYDFSMTSKRRNM